MSKKLAATVGALTTTAALSFVPAAPVHAAAPVTSSCKASTLRLFNQPVQTFGSISSACTTRRQAVDVATLGPEVFPLFNKPVVQASALEVSTVKSATGVSSGAKAAKATVNLSGLGLTISVEGLDSKVTGTCGPNAAFTARSVVGRLSVNGVPIEVKGPVVIPLGIATIRVNDTRITAGDASARALVVDLPGTSYNDVVVGSAYATMTC